MPRCSPGNLVAVLVISLLQSLWTPVMARPAIAIIIDDLGNDYRAGLRTVALPGAVACAVMPHTPYGAALARAAHAAGKDVMLHLPMQAMEMQRITGPGEISLENNEAQLKYIVATDLASIPHVRGVNNHMGSLITRHPGHMRWLMTELARYDELFFVDSYTSPASIAYDLALEHGLLAGRRDVFLDADRSPDGVARAFEQLLQKAARYGTAIGIGHPYPETLSHLEQVLPSLQDAGIRLLPVRELLHERLHQDDRAAALLSHDSDHHASNAAHAP